MNHSSGQLREQMLRYLDGTLPEAATRELSAQLQSAPELRREFAELLRQQVQLAEIGADLAEKGLPLPVEPARPAWGHSWKAAALTACLALVAALAFAFWPAKSRAPELRFARVAGEVWVERGDVKRRATASAALQLGDRVQTSFGATADLRSSREATRFHLREETTLSWPTDVPEELILEQGTIEATVAPQPRGQRWKFRTPQAEASVLGTEFLLASDGAATHLAVREGRVQLRGVAGGGAVVVAANQFGVVAENTPLAARPLPPDGQGTGLLGEYFSWGNFEKPTFRRLDPRVQFDWGTARPGPGLNEDHFQLRWTGAVQPKLSERYLFDLVADDGVRLWVDGQLLVDQWVIRSQQTKMRGEIVLEAGRKYDLRLEYFESSGKACVSLYWQSDSQPREIIPASQLYPPATHSVSTATKP